LKKWYKINILTNYINLNKNIQNKKQNKILIFLLLISLLNNIQKIIRINKKIKKVFIIFLKILKLRILVNTAQTVERIVY